MRSRVFSPSWNVHHKWKLVVRGCIYGLARLYFCDNVLEFLKIQLYCEVFLYLFMIVERAFQLHGVESLLGRPNP